MNLKAGWKDTATRLEQVEAMQVDLDDAESVMIVGDFNTYKKDRTELLEDDSVMITTSLGDEFSLVENEVPTYLGFGGRVFDRAWTKNLINLGAQVLGPCNKESVEVPYANRSFYNRFISDHCALKIVVE